MGNEEDDDEINDPNVIVSQEACNEDPCEGTGSFEWIDQ